jgi:mono/diheme cytochrome c family protein
MAVTQDLANPPSARNISSAVMGKIALAVVAALFAVLVAMLAVYHLRYADPYVQNVLSLTGDPVRGHAIFQMNCSGCHGLYADGQVGPSLRNVSDHRSRISLIHQVISGDTPPMPQFQPTEQEMADLLKYLESL